MSKKHKTEPHSQASSSSPTSEHAAEYRIIKHDLYKVIALNTLYLALVLALYYTNLKSSYLENWLSRIIKV
jgi:hypothetical protein